MKNLLIIFCLLFTNQVISKELGKPYLPEFNQAECAKYLDIIKADKKLREEGKRQVDDYNHIYQKDTYTFKDAANYAAEFIIIRYIGNTAYTQSQNAAQEFIYYDKSGTSVDRLIACTVNYNDGKFTYYGVDPAQVIEIPARYYFYDDNYITKFEYPKIQNGSYTILICNKTKKHIDGLPYGDSMTFFSGSYFDKNNSYDHKFIITIPEKFSHHLYTSKGNGLIKNFDINKTKNNGMLTYTLSFDELTKLKYEDNTVINSDLGFVPYVQFSTIKNWKEIQNTIMTAQEKVIKDGKDILLKELNKVAEFFKVKVSDIKPFHVFHYVQSNYRYVYAHTGSGGYIPNTIQSIIRNASGDCKDHAILLVGLLRAINYKAYPVVLRTDQSNNLNLEVPSIEFDHEIAGFYDQNNKLVFLDATHKYIPFGYLPERNCDRNYIMSSGKRLLLGKTPKQIEKTNYLTYDLTVNEDASCKTKTNLKLYGSMYENLMSEIKMNYSDEYLKNNLLNKFIYGESSEVLSYKFEHLQDFKEPFEVELDGVGKDCVLTVNDMLIYRPLVFTDRNFYKDDSRDLPLSFQNIVLQDIVLNIKIPKYFNIMYIPKDVDLKFASLGISTKYEKINSQTIKVTQSFYSKKTVIMPDEYLQYKADMEKIKKYEYERIVFKKI